MTRRIGFVDDCLDNFHADVYLKLLRGELADLGFTVAGCTALQTEQSQAWAVANDVPWFDTVDELDAGVDHYAILAPSTPDTHLTLCQQVFPYGKSTYVDKTFAPDLNTAEAIFSLADDHNLAVQTTSALRYTEVQQVVDEARARVHLGADVTRLMRWGDTPNRDRLLLEWAHGATGVVHVHTDGSTTPFAASISTGESTRYVTVDSGPIFSATACAFLELFRTGVPNVARDESLSIRRILDAAVRPDATQGFIDI